MHFQLPEHLKIQVAAYDPVLKPLIAEQKRATAKRATAPLGLPDDLLPVAFIDKETQLDIAKRINALPAEGRFMMSETDKLSWFVMHHESMWVATWFYKPGEYNRPDCVYGAKIAFKTAPSTLKKICRVNVGSINMSELSEMQCCNYGRTPFYHRTRIFTAAEIASGTGSNLPQNAVLNGYGQRSREKRSAFKMWANRLAQTIPTWKDADIFDRIKEGNNIAACIFHNYYEKQSGDIDASVFIKRFSLSNRRFAESPYGLREINKAVQECKRRYADPTTDSRRDVKAPFDKIAHQMQRVDDLLRFYPDAALDYCQKVYELGQYINAIRVPYGTENHVPKWLQDNMPIASFVGIIEKAVEEKLQEWADYETRRHSHSTGNSWGEPTFYPSDLNDTLSMIQRILASSPDATLEKPSRWRIAEFHDHVSAEAFKVSNPNEKLRQDLFPEPIRVDLSGQRWTFLQPQDVHQLAAWGQAVRNCVGNASSYKEGIKKRTHFIVLAMIDGKARFTIQLKVRNAVMSVEQIADIGNRRLDEANRELYQQAFAQALQIANSQLAE